MLKYLAIGVMFPVLAILFTKYLGEEYAWVNRKIIHFSSVPAILFFREGLVTGKELAAVVCSWTAINSSHEQRTIMVSDKRQLWGSVLLYNVLSHGTLHGC